MSFKDQFFAEVTAKAPQFNGDRGKATSAVVRENPALHASYLAEARENAGRPSAPVKTVAAHPYRDQFKAAVESAKASGLDAAKATSYVVKSQPALHQAMLAETRAAM